MITRTALTMAIVLGLTGCVEWVRFSAFEGPEPAAANAAVIRGFPPESNFQTVERVFRGEITYYEALTMFPKGAVGVEIVLLPGTYDIALTGRCSSQWDYSHGTYSATLQPGHTYEVKQGCCFSLNYGL
jgi:hypothetical protein